MSRFLFLSLCVGSSLIATSNAATIVVDPWTILRDYPDREAVVGDTVQFVWAGTHNVYIHPKGGCNEEDRILVGLDSPASYTFTEAGEISFACDIFSHCDVLNQKIKFKVSASAPPSDSPPTPAPPVNAPPVCFSEESSVNVQDKGRVNMRDLQIGDLVQVDEDSFEPVYSFAKRSTKQNGSFVRIHHTAASGQPLELSDSHFVYTADGATKQAGSIQPGDTLQITQGQVSTVTKTTTVSRQGYYSPLTYSGKILVNDVAASTFAYPTETLRIGNFDTKLSANTMMWWSQSPHRILCKSSSLDLCRRLETYDETTGASNIFRVYLWFHDTWESAGSSSILGVGLFWLVSAALLVCNAVEVLMDCGFVGLTLLTTGLYLSTHRGSKMHKLK